MSGRRGAPSLPLSRRFHELDGSAVGVADIDDAFSGIRTGFKRLRFTTGYPARGFDFFKHGIKIINKQSNVNVSDIAGTSLNMFPIRRREVLEQFDLVTSRCFYNCELDLSAS